MYVVSQRKISYLSDKLLSFRDCFYLVFTTGKFFSAKVPDALFLIISLTSLYILRTHAATIGLNYENYQKLLK